VEAEGAAVAGAAAVPTAADASTIVADMARGAKDSQIFYFPMRNHQTRTKRLRQNIGGGAGKDVKIVLQIQVHSIAGMEHASIGGPVSSAGITCAHGVPGPTPSPQGIAGVDSVPGPSARGIHHTIEFEP